MLLSRRAIAGATMVLAGAVAALLCTPAYASVGSPRATAAPTATCTQQSFLEGTHYSTVQVAQFAQHGGFTGTNWVIAVAVAEAESAGWSHARLIDTDCSVDRGMWQINSYWHSEVSDSCAFDPTCAAQATHTIWANGGWTQWTTYTNGAYQAHMAEAQTAVNQVSGGSGGGGGGSGGGGSGGTWQANTAYAVGQTVTYGGHTYRCLQSHTSLVGWEPPNVPALWQLVS
ncbi:MAG TPA: carbohydrate-binding protein [Rugosimonospora sp.]|jgi:hypothetical protein